jgi:hypothetical protein
MMQMKGTRDTLFRLAVRAQRRVCVTMQTLPAFAAASIPGVCQVEAIGISTRTCFASPTTV